MDCHEHVVLGRQQLVIGCTFGGLLHTFYLSKHVAPKYTILVGMLIGIAPSMILIILSGGGRGNDYWKFTAPGSLIGSSSMMLVFTVSLVSTLEKQLIRFIIGNSVVVLERYGTLRTCM